MNIESVVDGSRIVGRSRMRTHRGGLARDQHMLTLADGRRAFVSYETLIAVEDAEGWTYDLDADGYSATTSRYLNEATGTSLPERRKAREAGMLRERAMLMTTTY